ncbi:uncharacterized protein BJ212DRAFT_1479963 [Suillus subaureus]|uniref:Uncharacterized protein n=1 Tax=Suillus subaureus TaxID=48587 RepID=A0A9P7EDL7_9AGAM|nr:uncharacterized protein BJ212DRAFT_1479963 [Suillus subaureus]KAG1818137.1 hypothetical protein BJ212DRAFT_1479963 [Suillus subaureus]
MVFHAYVKQSDNGMGYWFVITFASCAVADEWWRAVSTSTIVKFVNSIWHVNAQFYTYELGQVDPCSSLIMPGVATQFFDKVFFMTMSDLMGCRLNIIMPPDHFVDHISGNSFFIHSKVSPHEYWYYPKLSNVAHAVYVSHTKCTRFCVSLSNGGTAGTIMIGSDKIIIMLTTINLSINVFTTSGQAIVSSAPKLGLKFSDLLSKFSVGPTLCKDNQGLDMEELIYMDDGEEWELT